MFAQSLVYRDGLPDNALQNFYCLASVPSASSWATACIACLGLQCATMSVDALHCQNTAKIADIHLSISRSIRLFKRSELHPTIPLILYLYPGIISQNFLLDGKLLEISIFSWGVVRAFPQKSVDRIFGRKIDVFFYGVYRTKSILQM